MVQLDVDFGTMSSFDKRKEYYERLGLEEGATTGRLSNGNRNFRSQELSFPGTKVLCMELSLPGTKMSWNLSLIHI